MMILQSQGGQRCKMQALCLAALEIVLEEIEGHLDDGEVEHPDRQIAFTQISDFAQMSRVYSDIWVCSDIWPYSDILLYSDIWVCSDIWLYSDAVGVLIISPTVGGCELGGLRSNVDSEGGKYTSAIASVYLPPSSSTLRWSCTRRKASTPRLRLGVLAFLLVQLQLKSPSSKAKFTSAAPRWTWPWTRGTWAESVGGHLVQLQLKSPSSSPSSYPPTIGLILKLMVITATIIENASC